MAFVYAGRGRHGTVGGLIGSVPALLFFFFFSRQRKAKFVFAFCLSDTVCMWTELSTILIDYAVKGNGVVTFTLRLAAFPLLEYAVRRLAFTRLQSMNGPQTFP